MTAPAMSVHEMFVYMRKDHGGRLEFVDISTPGFNPQNYGINLDNFMFQMHAIDRSGRVYRGRCLPGNLAGVSRIILVWIPWHSHGFPGGQTDCTPVIPDICPIEEISALVFFPFLGSAFRLAGRPVISV
jgi:hypothetical protein